MITCSHINADRLGNQLFRFAACYSLALENKDVFQVHWHKHPIVSGLEIPKFKNVLPDPEEIKSIYREPYFHYSKIPYESGMDIHGYYQSEKYFENHADVIRKLFYLKSDKQKSCAIHVRRGDYLLIPYILPTCTFDYYRKAMDFVSKSYGIKEFVIYTDDFDFCIEHLHEFEHGNFIIEVTEGKELDDFRRMQNHNAIIIANSTYSWWAAYLSGHNRIVCPSTWFYENYEASDIDLIPARWIRL